MTEAVAPRSPRRERDAVGGGATQHQRQSGSRRPWPLALHHQRTLVAAQRAVAVGRGAHLVHSIAGGTLLAVVTVEQQLHQLLRGGAVRHQQRLVLRPGHEDAVMDTYEAAAPHAHAEARVTPRPALLQLRGPRLVVQHQQSPQRGAALWGAHRHLHGDKEDVGVTVTQPELGEQHQHQLAAGGARRQAQRLVLHVRPHEAQVHLDGRHCWIHEGGGGGGP